MKHIFINTNTILKEPLPVTNNDFSEFLMIEEEVFDKADFHDKLEFYILDEVKEGNQKVFSIKEPFQKISRQKGLYSGVIGS